MKKRTACLILIWVFLNLTLSLFWSDIKEIANATRYCEAVGGEAFLWLVPSEVVFALSMLWKDEERADG